MPAARRYADESCALGSSGVETAYHAHRERRGVLPRGILLEDGVRAAPDRMGWISGAITWVLGLLSQELASVWEIHARRSTSVEKTVR